MENASNFEMNGMVNSIEILKHHKILSLKKYNVKFSNFSLKKHPKQMAQ